MKTMTATQARQSLGAILSRVLQGEDIGIVHSGSGKIVALRPVEVYSEDYGLVDYGLTSREMKRAEKHILKGLKRERTRRWDGTGRGLRG
jgi:antitoxin (DNA-binding transcriptional repressor) of toxin-antitoxin stability system